MVKLTWPFSMKYFLITAFFNASLIKSNQKLDYLETFKTTFNDYLIEYFFKRDSQLEPLKCVTLIYLWIYFFSIVKPWLLVTHVYVYLNIYSTLNNKIPRTFVHLSKSSQANIFQIIKMVFDHVWFLCRI